MMIRTYTKNGNLIITGQRVSASDFMKRAAARLLDRAGRQKRGLQTEDNGVVAGEHLVDLVGFDAVVGTGFTLAHGAPVFLCGKNRAIGDPEYFLDGTLNAVQGASNNGYMQTFIVDRAITLTSVTFYVSTTFLSMTSGSQGMRLYDLTTGTPVLVATGSITFPNSVTTQEYTGTISAALVTGHIYGVLLEAYGSAATYNTPPIYPYYEAGVRNAAQLFSCGTDAAGALLTMAPVADKTMCMKLGFTGAPTYEKGKVYPVGAQSILGRQDRVAGLYNLYTGYVHAGGTFPDLSTNYPNSNLYLTEAVGVTSTSKGGIRVGTFSAASVLHVNIANVKLASVASETVRGTINGMTLNTTSFVRVGKFDFNWTTQPIGKVRVRLVLYQSPSGTSTTCEVRNTAGAVLGTATASAGAGYVTTTFDLDIGYTGIELWGKVGNASYAGTMDPSKLLFDTAEVALCTAPKVPTVLDEAYSVTVTNG